MTLLPGLYEKIVNKQLQEELSSVAQHCKDVRKVDEASSADVLAQYLAGVVLKGLNAVQERRSGGLEAQIALANKIVDAIRQMTDPEDKQYFSGFSIEQDGKAVEELYGILSEAAAGQPGRPGKAQDLERPQTSLARSFLFTGQNSNDPKIFQEIKKEIASCDRIDMLVSFLRWSGFRLIMKDLADAAKRGCHLRIITTPYTGATEVKVLDALCSLENTSIKVCYDTSSTRMHAKAWIFHRSSSYSTAYVGSSNLSRAALDTGLEWNIKVTNQDLPDILAKIASTFESYWNSPSFEDYANSDRDRFMAAIQAQNPSSRGNAALYTLDITPYGFQQEILDKLEAERERGYFSNLVVAATGTGKTVLAALDYKRFRQSRKAGSSRLLFVAHREEILTQSLATFRAVLKDNNFGELYVGAYRPQHSYDALFMSIQSFNSQDFSSRTAPGFYDYIIVDEFHHAASPSYGKLLACYKPRILLGLTATPERLDGQSILPYFNNRIAAEIRLPEAVERNLLCPFQYFGVSDDVDLSGLSWTRGCYDKGELSSLYCSGSAAEARARIIVERLLYYVSNIDDVKGLGFCVSVDHAAFMADRFNKCNIPSIALTGGSSDQERRTAKDRLVKGEIRFIFVVDIYNEGVDIPEVNTVLFLRPTESLTIFLQQLGRGLRKAEGKECLTVLDFIGQANKRYRFEEKLASLLATNTHSIRNEIKNGFVSVPSGCYIQLEEKAASYILNNIRASYDSTGWLTDSIASFANDTGKVLSLAAFLDYYRMDPRLLYKKSSFSRLCARAGVRADFQEPLGDELLRVMQAFAVVNSSRFLRFTAGILANPAAISLNSFTEAEKRMLRMLYLTIASPQKNWTDDDMIISLQKLAEAPVLTHEFLELIDYQLDHIDIIPQAVDFGFDCPLELHCSYTRNQLLAAMDIRNPGTIREGVKWIKEKKLDVFMVTLNKSDKEYSPTTLYMDYSINSRLFHWQSQSTTSVTSETGQRYIRHQELGSRVMLFVREYKLDRLSDKAEAYTFLGPVRYHSHKGSRPISIIWELEHPIPAKFLKKTNKMLQE